MFQSAIDLSKQWPQAILRIGLGANFFAMLLSWANGSNLEWLTVLSNRVQSGHDMSLIVTALFLLANCYVAGSIFASSGEATLLGFNTDFRVKMAADVFDTGNGLLISKYQEAIRNAQLFGGLLSSVFFGGVAIWIFSILTGQEDRVFGEVYGLSASTAPEVASVGDQMSWGRFLMFSALSIGLFLGLWRTVKQMTFETFIAIAVEIKLRRATTQEETTP